MDGGLGDLLGCYCKLKVKSEKLKLIKNLNLKIKNFGDFILDLLFPINCVGCGKEGEWICSECQNEIIQIKEPTCPNCNRLTSNGKFCPRCREKSYLTGVIVAAYYKEGPLKEAIHTFKYDGVFDLAKDLGKILTGVLENRWKKRAILIPVPLHKKRRAKRGYNQSELLTREINKNVLRGVLPILINKLIRHKFTKKTQVELSGQKRRENMKNCFSWVGTKNELQGKTVILIDDIYTTGSTLQECARIIRQNAGVREVWGLVLAKA